MGRKKINLVSMFLKLDVQVSPAVGQFGVGEEGGCILARMLARQPGALNTI